MALRIVSRSEWGAPRVPDARKIVLPTPQVWLHHTGVPVRAGAAGMRALRSSALASGKSDIPYSFIIDPTDATIFEARGAGFDSAATLPYNGVSHAICVMGNFEELTPTSKMLETIAVLLVHGFKEGWWAYPLLLGGHKEVSNTGTPCPGKNLFARFDSINARASSLARISAGFIQGRFGNPGNFELVIPGAAGQLRHYFRENNKWREGRTPQFGEGRYTSAALIQSNFTSGGPGHFEVIGLKGHVLEEWYRIDRHPWTWKNTGRVILDHRDYRNRVAGPVGFIQRKSGTPRNFELAAPLLTGGLVHYFRDNTPTSIRWQRGGEFGKGNYYSSAALIQSTYGPGNLEVLAVNAKTKVLEAFYGDRSGTWSLPTPVKVGNTNVRVAGPVGFIQGKFGRPGNFELVIPIPDRQLAHFFRDNSSPVPRWQKGADFKFGDKTYRSAALFQSTFTFGGPGNLEVVAMEGNQPRFFWRGDVPPFEWSRPMRL